MEELKLEKTQYKGDITVFCCDAWEHGRDSQYYDAQQVVDKLKAEITSKDKGIELLNASIKCFESAIEEYKQEKKEIFTTTKSIICGLCYRLNPQHKDMDYGKGCKHCKEIDDIERKLNI